MKKSILYVPMLWGLLVLLAGCQEEPGVDTLYLSGVESAYNVSRSAYFGSFADQDSIVPLAAVAGDLIFVTAGEYERTVYFRYNPEMGTYLDLHFDSLNQAAFSMNGRLESIDLTAFSSARELFSELPVTTLDQVSSVYLEFPLQDEQFDALRHAFSPNKQLNLIVEGNDSLDQLTELFRWFRPEWVVMTDLQWEHPATSWLTGLKDTRMLATGLSGSDPRPFFADMPSLEQLIISADPERPFPELSLGLLKHLRSLSIMDAGTIDLKFLAEVPWISDLYLFHADSVINTGVLEQVKELEGLGFSGCSLSEALPDLPELEWFSMPDHVDQAGFAAWCEEHPELQVLEATDDTMITDLGPLKGLEDLRVLQLGLPKADLSTLKELQGLELLVIHQNILDEEGSQLRDLRAALPGTRIVPGGGFCMGSGYILLLIPFLLAGIIFLRRTRSGSAN